MPSTNEPSAQFEQLSPTSYRVDITVPEDMLKGRMQAIYSHLAQEANIPGFRPGKIPHNIINRHYGKERILAEATEEVMNDTFWPLIRDRELTVIGNPRIDTKGWKEGGELKYVAVFEVIPQVPQIDYANIHVILPNREITDDDIEVGLRRFRILFGSQKKITDRPTQTGDFLNVDIEMESKDVTVPTIEGEVPWKMAENDMELELGGGKAIPGLEDALTGVELEEIKQFELTIPDDFPDKRVREKTVSVKARVKEIAEITRAELTDELIKEKLSAQGIETVESLKAKIVQELQSTNARMDERAKSEQIEAHLASDYDFPLPEGMVRAEYNDILDRSLSSLKDSGIDVDEMMKPDNDKGIKLRKRARYQAERMTRLSLLFSEIARREAIHVGDEEVANYIMMQAYHQGLREADLKLLIKDPHFISSTKDNLLRLKVGHFLISKVDVETIPFKEYRDRMEEHYEKIAEDENSFVESI
ncbi:MAG TPA: trigger factor, partial [Firmicutes bacterium]|nr:trigger factor [Bacillota bacterium]